MLQINKLRPIELRPIQQQTFPASELISPAELYAAIIGFVRRQSRIIGVAFFLTLALGAVYVVTSPPRYTGRAVLVIDAHKTQLFQNEAPLSNLPVDSTAVDTQIEILNSDSIASSVIEELHLNEDPEFISPRVGVVGTLVGSANEAVNSVLSVFMPSTANAPAPASDELLAQRALGTFQSRLKVRRVGLTYAIEINFDSFNPDRAAQVANAVVDAYAVDSLETKYQVTKRASVWLQERLKELREESTNAERAVVDYKTKNNIVDTGGRLMNEQQLAEYNSELIQVRAQTAEAKARLDRVQQILAAGDVDPGAATTATVADTMHNDVITKLRSQYLDYDARARDWAQKYGPNHLAVVNLRNQLGELRRSIAEELKRTAETYQSDYEIAKEREKSIQRSLEQIVTDSQTTNEAAVTLHNLESSAQTYRALYDNFLQRYMESVQQQSFPISESRVISKAKRPLGKSAPKSMLDLALAGLAGLILGGGLGILRDISDRVFRTPAQIEEHLRADCISLVPLANYASATAREASASASAASAKENFRSAQEISTAVQEASASANNASTSTDEAPTSAMPASASAKAACSSAQAASSPAQDASPSAPEASASAPEASASAPEASASAPEASASAPEASASAKDASRSEAAVRQLRKAGSPGPRTIVRDTSVRWMVVDSPLSRFAEAIRAIKVAADLEHVGKASKVIGITSSLPNEGKSTVAVSLAALIAHSGGRAVLVDCDLRNPSVSKALAPNAKRGLLDVISGKAELDDVMWSEGTSGLAFLPAVVPRRLAHSSDLLASGPTRALFEKLRGTYDYVIVDLSPLAPVVDVRVITPMVDSFLFVVEWGRTKIDVVEHALSNAPGIHDNLLGVVLNKTNMNALGRYQHSYGNYYYNQDYAQYGYSD
jgi:succinoglycan biosynthesis transport protein ExoP